MDLFKDFLFPLLAQKTFSKNFPRCIMPRPIRRINWASLKLLVFVAPVLSTERYEPSNWLHRVCLKEILDWSEWCHKIGMSGGKTFMVCKLSSKKASAFLTFSLMGTRHKQGYVIKQRNSISRLSRIIGFRWKRKSEGERRASMHNGKFQDVCSRLWMMKKNAKSHQKNCNPRRFCQQDRTALN